MLASAARPPCAADQNRKPNLQRARTPRTGEHPLGGEPCSSPAAQPGPRGESDWEEGTDTWTAVRLQPKPTTRWAASRGGTGVRITWGLIAK